MGSTDIATIEATGYLALERPTAEIQEIIADNLAGQEVGEFDLPRVTIPAGGGTRWEVGSPLTGTESLESLEGIIVYQRLVRAYWPSDDVSGEPPQCSSRDAIVGVGDPGGDCKTCPYAQFGSDGRRGQACKQQTMWFVLRPDSFLPVVLGLPPTSLKAAKQYALALAGAGIALSGVVTSIALEADRNPDGQKYSRAVPTLGARLDAAGADRARQYAALLRPIFDATPAVDAAPVGDRAIEADAASEERGDAPS